ncbi:MAG: response regulator [Janthinobacterium lividum]
MIRVFVVDDHPVLRSGLHAMLANQPDLTVVGEASSGLDLLAQLPTAPADVVLLDSSMPGLSGPETAQRLAAEYPAVRVLALSMLASVEHIYQMLDAGAQGYILKNADLTEIIHGIRTVAAGRLFLCSEIGLTALHRLRGEPAQPASVSADKTGTLSKRETEVLQLIAQGFTTGEIADKLFTSKRTIETHRQNIIAKTQTKNTASLIRFAVSEGLVA